MNGSTLHHANRTAEHSTVTGGGVRGGAWETWAATLYRAPSKTSVKVRSFIWSSVKTPFKGSDPMSWLENTLRTYSLRPHSLSFLLDSMSCSGQRTISWAVSIHFEITWFFHHYRFLFAPIIWILLNIRFPEPSSRVYMKWGVVKVCGSSNKMQSQRNLTLFQPTELALSGAVYNYLTNLPWTKTLHWHAFLISLSSNVASH